LNMEKLLIYIYLPAPCIPNPETDALILSLEH
jgi:hypothetical protein